MASAVDTVNSFIDLEIARLYLEIDPEDRSRDELLIRLINSVAHRMNSFTRRLLRRRTYTSVTMNGTGEPQMFLDQWPIDTTQTFNVYADETRAFGADTKLTIWSEIGGLTDQQVIADAASGELERVDGGVWPFGNKTVLVAPYTAGVGLAEEEPFQRAQLEILSAWSRKIGVDPSVSQRSEFEISESKLVPIMEQEIPADARKFLTSERRTELFA